MNLRVLFFVSLFFAVNGAHAASEPKAFNTFDGYLAPVFGLSSGSYSAGSVDKGSTFGYQLGARAGVKLGPILLGGEFSEAQTTRSSSQKSSMSQADQDKYSVNASGKFTAIAVNLGVMSDRATFWFNYYPAMDFEAKYWVASGLSGADQDYKYSSGKAYSVEVDYRIYNRLYLGVFAIQREFSTISAGALSGADLDPKLKFTSYGLSLSYLVSWGDLASISKSFPSH